MFHFCSRCQPPKHLRPCYKAYDDLNRSKNNRDWKIRDLKPLNLAKRWYSRFSWFFKYKVLGMKYKMDDLVSVQPMKMLSGEVFFMDFKYAEKKVEEILVENPLIADKILPVETMDMPSGNVFFLDFKYGTKKVDRTEES